MSDHSWDELRALYAGNPLIDRIERWIREAMPGPEDEPDLADATALLPRYPHYKQLTERERLAVLARFTVGGAL